ncbi:MAG TPA: hypothetical protein VHE35_19845 [Kofleriaceae bacterium]|nr:hypothetical protein [Kofleriaceae bacterium]
MTSRRSLFVLAALFSLAAAAVAVRPAAADRKPEDVFAGKIITSDKPFPFHAKSNSAFIATIKKQSKAQFWEDKDKKTWKIFFAAFFKRPLGDIEMEVKLYDNQQPGRPMVASFEQYLDQRGQRALLSEFTLEHKLVGVNRELWMVIEVDGATVATGKFKILGEGEHFTGKVDFSADDDEDDDDKAKKN